MENKGYSDFVSEAQRINYTIKNQGKLRELIKHWDATDGVKRANQKTISA